MLDIDFLRRKIKLIQEDISRLEELGEYSLEEIAKDHIKFAAVERFLEKIITRALDINRHIIAEMGKGDEPVRGYEDTFLALCKFSVYDRDFAEKIAPSAGLRNRLVHEYNSTKQEILYQSVKDAISQYSEYCDYILNFIHSNEQT